MTSKRAYKPLMLLVLIIFLNVAQAASAGVSSASSYQDVSSQVAHLSTPESQSPEKNKQVEDENDAYRHSATVKALGGMLGMNVEQSATAFEVANFVVLALLLGWVLAKILPGKFRSRNTAIQRHLVDARTATEEASARLSGVEQRLGKLDEQIAAMRAQAERDSALDEQRIKASLDEEKARILSDAEQEISAATAMAQRQLQQYAVELAVEQAARKLVVTTDMDRLLIQNFARGLAGDDPKDGQN